MTLLYSISGLRGLLLIFQNWLFNILYGRVFTNKVKVFGLPIISFANHSEVKVGTNLVLISHSYFSEPGIDHPVVIRTLNSSAKLVIGNNVGISGGGICVAQEVVIGDDVMMGANSFITDTDFHPVDPEKRRFRKDNVASRRVIIEENVFIGMNSTILKGARIGKNSVIAAGSIVTKDIPPNSIAAGVPARVIGQVDYQRQMEGSVGL